MNKRTAIKIFKDFVTGNLETKEFWELYKKEITLQNVLRNDRRRKKGIIKTKDENGVPVIWRFPDKHNPINPDNLLEVIDIDRLEHKYILFAIINKYFLMRGIHIPEDNFNQDAKEYLFLQSMVPNYVEIDDMSFLQKLYLEAPTEYSKSKKAAWCKSKMKEMFAYDKKAPAWYQFSQWPYLNGVPMVFSHQETSKEGIELYYFYDKVTKEQVVVEQIE